MEVDGIQFENVLSAKVLGVMIQNNLKWNTHVDEITSKDGKGLYILRQLKRSGINPSNCSAVLLHCDRISS